jgi:hypothetical protein
MTKEINCVWIGNQLSIMEKLSLALAVKSGYNVILWSYCTFDDLPIGVTHKIIDKEILNPIGFNGIPHPHLLNGGIGSLSHWSDYFAFNILHKNGGYWMQLDLAILNDIDIKNEYSFTSWGNGISPVFMKIPKGSEYAKTMSLKLEELLKTGMQNLQWEYSMQLMHNIANEHNIYNDCKLLNSNDGYYDCGCSASSPYNSPTNLNLSMIHWSNATHNSSKSTPIINSKYYDLCKENNLI